jgi:hypothetical protein
MVTLRAMTRPSITVAGKDDASEVWCGVLGTEVSCLRKAVAYSPRPSPAHDAARTAPSHVRDDASTTVARVAQ